ncbi:LysR substrate-binding domain-containing protein [Methylobacterium dankookense]|uniref:FMN reductase (NADH) RutF n=1 Tax=Methylobacterium dankookense TaxID=560405 RepID=A0A564FYZ0_9HYPH|nr:LysR substrate-binding domain-containing protein [Methylobacterium dankookense]GJD59219.1 FMN reductase (NADH) RutF [Methylobacterium dankookense]VUF13094.1 FMN reductase (NADH) RutF [Methylobacterium dankookense]
MLQPTPSDPDLRARFLGGMAAAACTVNVVTTDGAAGRFGVTVSAMASVSADTERPTLLVCVHRQSRAAEAIRENGVFCVNVLRDDQSYISDCFAGRYRTPDGDKFSCARWTTQVTGAPRVVDPLVAFDCRLVSQVEVGTHYVFFGAVADLYRAEPGSPLIYANRAYGTPTRHADRAAEAPPATEALRVGAFHTFGPHLLPGLLGRLSEAGHAIDLKLLEGDQRRVVEGLKAGEVDLALVYDLDLGEGLATDPLDALQPYVLLAEGHPLAARAALALEDLASEPMILLDAPPSGRYFLSLFEAAGLAPTVRVRTLSFEMARGLVAHGFGYALLATRPASGLSYDGRPLVSRPLDRAVAPSRLVLARRAEGRLGPAAEAFRRACAARFADAPAEMPALEPTP